MIYFRDNSNAAIIIRLACTRSSHLNPVFDIILAETTDLLLLQYAIVNLTSEFFYELLVLWSDERVFDD